MVPPSKSHVLSGSESSLSGASRALLPQSDCVVSASEQVGVLGVCSMSKSGSRTKSMLGSGKQTVGPDIQLSGLKGMSSLLDPLLMSQGLLRVRVPSVPLSR